MTYSTRTSSNNNVYLPTPSLTPPPPHPPTEHPPPPFVLLILCSLTLHHSLRAQLIRLMIYIPSCCYAVAFLSHCNITMEHVRTTDVPPRPHLLMISNFNPDSSYATPAPSPASTSTMNLSMHRMNTWAPVGFVNTSAGFLPPSTHLNTTAFSFTHQRAKWYLMSM